MLHHPIQCLYLLEINFQEKVESQPNLPESDPDNDPEDSEWLFDIRNELQQARREIESSLNHLVRTELLKFF